MRTRDVWLAGRCLGSWCDRPARSVPVGGQGVALGVATMVAVLGISSSSRAQLVAEIDALGTNLLTITPAQSFSGATVTLPRTAPGDGGPHRTGARCRQPSAMSPPTSTGATTSRRPDTWRPSPCMPPTPGCSRTLQGQHGQGPVPERGHRPSPRRGARRVGGQRAGHHDLGGRARSRFGSGNTWFSVVGILDPLALGPRARSGALVGGFPVAEQLLHADGSPVQVYVRTYPTSVDAVRGVLAATADPAAPQDGLPSPTRPDALIAQADASARPFRASFSRRSGRGGLLLGGRDRDRQRDGHRGAGNRGRRRDRPAPGVGSRTAATSASSSSPRPRSWPSSVAAPRDDPGRLCHHRVRHRPGLERRRVDPGPGRRHPGSGGRRCGGRYLSGPPGVASLALGGVAERVNRRRGSGPRYSGTHLVPGEANQPSTCRRVVGP